MDKFDTLMKKKKGKSLDNFNFEDFEQEAVQRLLSGEELTGKDGVITSSNIRILYISK